MAPEQKQALEKFGKQIVNEVFDRSCNVLEMIMSHGTKKKGGKTDKLYLAFRSLDQRSAEVVRLFTLMAIDQTFAQFLNYLDEHEIVIPMETNSGEFVDIRTLSDGLAA